MMDQQFGSRRMRAGDLTVYLRRAEHIKGCSGRGKPYAKLSLGDKTRSSKRFQRSRVKQDAGSNPVWDEQFHFHIEHSGLDKSVLYISLHHENMILDASLGSLKIDIAHVLEKNKVPFKWYSIYQWLRHKAGVKDKVPYKWYTVYHGSRHKARGQVELALSFVELQDQGDSETLKRADTDPALSMASLAVGVGQLVTGALAVSVALGEALGDA